MINTSEKVIYDFIVIGGGILGLSTAWQLQRQYPDKTVLIVEKESALARHQTGHNSGVIHAGVYYKPGSLKARFCKEGNVATKAFCKEHDIHFDECGKLLVATDAAELQRMKALVQRCRDNGIFIEELDQAQLKEREPNVKGVGAIFVPSTGIVDFSEICEKLGHLIVENGGEIRYETEVSSLEQFADRVTLFTNQGRLMSRFLVICAGLQSDKMVEMMGLEPDFRIIPFRGEYFLLDEKHDEIVNHLIYPIPDPDLPFLGVHLTKMINGTVTVGPNAVLAFKREGYKKTDFSIKDSWEMLVFPGMFKLVFKNLRASLTEFKNSISKNGYLRLVQKYCPSIELSDLKSYPAGVRAQAVKANGELVDDFLFMNTKRVLAVCNAPSPAATSALPIGEHIVEKVSVLVSDVE